MSNLFDFDVPEIDLDFDPVAQERAKGELKNLLELTSGLTDNEIKWIEILSKKKFFSDKEIDVIDKIYVRRCR